MCLIRDRQLTGIQYVSPRYFIAKPTTLLIPDDQKALKR
jgi:hypothetical protein